MAVKPRLGKRKSLVKAKRKVLVKARSATAIFGFDEVVQLIDAAKMRAVMAANKELIDLYWNIGGTITRRIAADGWGKATVEALSAYVQRRHPGVVGFSASNLWRMRQFFETYRDEPKLAPLVRELSWTHNLLIMSGSKRTEEREFYLRLTVQERWGKRQLQRQIAGALFERTILAPPKLAPLVRELHPEAFRVFKDTYLVEFLDLPPGHSEADLHAALVEQLKRFLIELGRDFCFVGSKYRIQVGGRDFEIDLVFFNRALNCLVAFELKIDQFEPGHLGTLQFYLESLDRDVRKPHENPAIGVLLCATKDDKVVEYALSRSLSPALVAEYQTRMPDKKLLQAKLHEFYALAQEQSQATKAPSPTKRLPKPADRPTARRRATPYKER